RSPVPRSRAVAGLRGERQSYRSSAQPSSDDSSSASTSASSGWSTAPGARSRTVMAASSGATKRSCSSEALPTSSFSSSGASKSSMASWTSRGGLDGRSSPSRWSRDSPSSCSSAVVPNASLANGRSACSIIASSSSPGSSSRSSPPSTSRSGGRESSEVVISSSPLGKRPLVPCAILVLQGYGGFAERPPRVRRGTWVPSSSELMRAEDAGWNELHALVDSLAPEEAERPGYYTEGWSASDLLAHVGSWLAAGGAVLERVRAGTYRREEIDVDAWNERFLRAMKDVPFHDVKAQAYAARARMLQAWDELDG